MPGKRSTPPAPDAEGMFSLLGEHWNHQLLREIFYGTNRFGELQRTLQIPPTTLTARLNGLVDAGLIDKRRYRDDKDWYDYELSELGRDVVPLWVAFARWARVQAGAPAEHQAGIRHRTCGADFDPVVICTHCGEQAVGADLEA